MATGQLQIMRLCQMFGQTCAFPVFDGAFVAAVPPHFGKVRPLDVPATRNENYQFTLLKNH